jgi:hypothetical protein
MNMTPDLVSVNQIQEVSNLLRLKNKLVFAPFVRE